MKIGLSKKNTDFLQKIGLAGTLCSVSLRNPPSPLYFPDRICLFTVTRFVFTGDDYCVDSDDETEECKQRDTEENCNLLCDT